jgi:hypothetical protein
MTKPSFSFRFLRVVSAVVTPFLALLACDENPDNPPLGSMDITTTAPALATELRTDDGWTIAWKHYLVHIASVRVAGDDGVVAASAPSPQLIDQAAPGTKSLLHGTVRTARPWENVSLQIGPAPMDSETEIEIVAPATEADRDLMRKEGLSIRVEATASKDGVVKTLDLRFTTDTVYAQCQEGTGALARRGLDVKADGNDTANIVMNGGVLFVDQLTPEGFGGASPVAEAIATADRDGDGIVTLAELHARPLDDARRQQASSSSDIPNPSGRYDVGERTDITTLGQFVEEQARRTVQTFRDSGTCTPEAAGMKR